MDTPEKLLQSDELPRMKEYTRTIDRPPTSERDIAQSFFNGRVSAPFKVICEVTYRCNAKCIHCYAPTPHPYRITELTLKEWKKVFDDISDMGAFRAIFTGGEPLLRDDLFEMVEYVHNLGLAATLETNGSLLNRKTIEKLVNAGINVISISLNRSTPHDYDKFSGYKGLFNKVIDDFRILKDYSVDTAVFATVTKVNMKDIPEIIDIAADVKAGRIAFVHLSPAGRAKTNAALYPTPQEHIDLLKRIYEKELQHPDLVIKYPNLPAFYFQESIGLDVYEKIQKRRGYIELCPAGTTSYVIDPEGDVKPCTVTAETAMGNVKKDSLRDIWLSSPILEHLRDTKKHMETPCDTCDLVDICVAGHRCLDYQLDYLKDHENRLAAPLCEQCYQYKHARGTYQ